MLNISPPDYKFCPLCGQELAIRQEEGYDRKFCHSCRWTYYPHVFTSACGIAIKNHRVLMVRRLREPYRGTWMFPAGFVSYGEHPRDTLIREIKEETGYQVVSSRLLDVIQVDDDPRALGHFAFMYKIKVSGRLDPGDPQENSAVAWFDLDKLPPIGWHSQRLMFEKLRQGYKN